jgi:hypothetical protein
MRLKRDLAPSILKISAEGGMAGTRGMPSYALAARGSAIPMGCCWVQSHDGLVDLAEAGGEGR